MKKKRNLFSLFSVICIVTSMLLFNVTSADPVLSEASQKLRENYGLSKSSEQLKKAKQDSQTNKSLEIYGGELTNEEVSEIENRTQIVRQTSITIRELANNKEIQNYAGIYTDSKTGIIYVGLVGLNENSQNKVLEKIQHKDKVKFYNATFTADELSVMMELLNAKLPELQNEGLEFSSFGISEEENRIVIYLPSEDEKNKNLFKKVVDEKYLTFKTMPKFEPMAATDKVRPVQGGLQLKKSLFSGVCTSGFVAYGPTQGTLGILTAGHCYGSGDSVYQPSASSSSNKLGNVSVWSGNGSNADAAWVQFSDGTPAIYNGKPVKGKLHYAQYGVVEGDTLHFQGVATGHTTGTISGLDVTITSGSNTYYHQRTATATVGGGDSGGPVWKIYNGSDIYAEGIISGGNNGFLSYSQILRIEEAINVSPKSM